MALSGLATVDLVTLQSVADLQVRLDRKYIVDRSTVADVIDELANGLAVLKIAGATDFAYESVYFDNSELASYLASAHGRRRRFKVRTRSYLDAGNCVLEMKTAGGRGHTVKVRHPHVLDRRSELTTDGRRFLADQGLPVAVIAELRPTLTTSYRRSTLLGTGFRCTLDTGLICRSPAGRSVRLEEKVLLESKSPGGATALDRALWRRGNRPVRISKYGTGLAALHPELPANTWHRTLGRYFAAPMG